MKAFGYTNYEYMNLVNKAVVYNEMFESLNAL
jgi:hypothetical protein